MDNSQLVNDKSSLEAAPDISTLDCSESPSLNNSSSFSLLPEDSQAPSSLFVSPVSPPVLGEAVLQGRERLWCGTGLQVAVGPDRAAFAKRTAGGDYVSQQTLRHLQPSGSNFLPGRWAHGVGGILPSVVCYGNAWESETGAPWCWALYVPEKRQSLPHRASKLRLRGGYRWPAYPQGSGPVESRGVLSGGVDSKGSSQGRKIPEEP